MFTLVVVALLVLVVSAVLVASKYGTKGKAKWFWVVAGLVLVLALVIFLVPLLWRTFGGVSQPVVWGAIAFVGIIAVVVFINRRKAADALVGVAIIAAIFALSGVTSWGINDLNGTADTAAGCSKDLFRANSRVEIGDTPTFLRVCGTYTTYLRYPRRTNKQLEVTLVENRVSDFYTINDLFVVCRYGDTNAECRPNGLSPGDASLTPRKRAFNQALGTLKTPIQIEAKLVDP